MNNTNGQVATLTRKPSERIREDMAFEVDVLLEKIDNELSLQTAHLIPLEKLARMSDFGFTSFHELKSPERVNELIEERNLVKHYQLHYPMNLFVTEEIITTILKKYNLFNGFPKNYIGTIPEKNMDEILAFRIRHQDTHPVDTWTNQMMSSMMWGTQPEATRNPFSVRDADSFQWAVPSWNQQDASLRQMGRMEQFARDRDRMDRENFIRRNPLTEADMFQPHKYLMGTDPIDPKVIKEANNELIKPDLEIIAPQEMFRTDTRSRWDGRTMVTDDPIVTAKVKGGRLIVTAWDIEAAIPEIQNPNKN